MTSRKKDSLIPCKSGTGTGTETDRISDLPDVIINHILSYLPIKDRAKTNLLSSKWRFKWTNNPILKFNNQTLPVLKNHYDNAMINKLVSDIDCVLLFHVGPISKFELSYHHHLPITHLHRWMTYISRHLVTELVLKLCERRIYKLPSCVFSLISLTSLELVNCVLRPPSTFKGFKNLKCLNLENVAVQQNVFEKFISSCPLLEKLNFAYINWIGIDVLNISAPNLQCFGFEGPFVNISLKDTNRITEFSMSISFEPNDHSNKSFDLVELLAAMPLIETLAIENSSLKYLIEGLVIPRALRVVCTNLRYLSIAINHNFIKELSALLCLLRSSPNLQELNISFRWEIWEINGDVWQADQWNHPFTCLRYIEISYFCGKQYEIDFISFMLLTSPALVKMVISVDQGYYWGYNSDKTKLDLTMRLLCLKRASNQAQIIFRDR